jgi:hypothetical protein
MGLTFQQIIQADRIPGAIHQEVAGTLEQVKLSQATDFLLSLAEKRDQLSDLIQIP